MPGAATGSQPNCPPQFPLQFLGTGQGHFGAMEQHGQLQLHPQAQLGLPAQPPPQAHCLQHVPGLQPGETPMQYDIRATQMALQLIAGSGLSGLSSLLFNGGVPPAKQADAKQGNARKDTPSKDTPAKKKVKTRSSSSQSSCSSASSAKKLSRRTALQRVATKRSRAAPLPVQKGRERKEKANDKHKEKPRDDKVKSAKKNGRRSDRHRELSSEDGASSTPRSLSFSPPKDMGRGRGRSPDAGGRSPGARGRSPVARGRSPGAASRGSGATSSRLDLASSRGHVADASASERGTVRSSRRSRPSREPPPAAPSPMDNAVDSLCSFLAIEDDGSRPPTPLPQEGEVYEIDEVSAWIASRTSIKQLHEVCKAHQLTLRFESKLLTVTRILRNTAEMA